jgi:glycosyltransferase involved in cell wall biosynthesis
MDQGQSLNARVSIVIPVYNSHNTLSKCLDSMIAQTYLNLEIICVNDCSKDNSEEIIRDYQRKDDRVKLINHIENKNAGGARNSGIKAATGTYVCFVDNDDWLTPDAIEILVDESENSSIDFVAADWCEWFSEVNYIEHLNLLDNVSKDKNCEYALKYGCRILGCLIRREIFFRNNLFYPEYSFWEDNAIGISLLYSSNSIKVVRKSLYYYYVSPGSSSRSFNLRKTADRIKTTQLAYDNLNRLGFISERNKELVNSHILCFSYFSIRMLAINYSSEAKKLLKLVIGATAPLLPNSTLKALHSNYVFTLAHPILSYYLWAIGYKCKETFCK